MNLHELHSKQLQEELWLNDGTKWPFGPMPVSF